MKLISFFLCSILMVSVIAKTVEHQWPEATVVGKVVRINSEYYIYTTEGGKTVAYPLTLQRKLLEKLVEDLKQNEEVVARGEIRLTSRKVNESMVFEPHFAINDIKVVSLNKLGVGKKSFSEPQVFLKSNIDPYQKPGIIIPTKVAASLIFMASFLMANKMANFQNGGGESFPSKQLKDGVILSAGALATGLMIDEHLRQNPVR